MNTLKIRKANLQDIDAAYLVIDECKKLLSQQGMDNWARYTKEKVSHLINSDDMFVFTKDHEVVGTVKISAQAPAFFDAHDMEKWENPTANAFYFTALAVAPKHQARGYGSILLNYSENYALTHRISYLRMTMLSANLALMDYYVRRGFVFRQKRKVEALGLTLSFGEKSIR